MGETAGVPHKPIERKVPDRTKCPYPVIWGGVKNPSIRWVSSIMRATTEITGVSRSALRSRRREYAVSRVRHLIYWIAWHTTEWAPGAISMRFGANDHASVIHGVRAVNRRLERDPKLAILLDGITRRALEIDAEPRFPISHLVVEPGSKNDEVGHGQAA